MSWSLLVSAVFGPGQESDPDEFDREFAAVADAQGTGMGQHQLLATALYKTEQF
jgi:hypothetical protein